MCIRDRFNVGTGRAQSFNELAEAIFLALGMKTNIEYIDMPEHLNKKYQYYTKAEMRQLREVGYEKKFMDLKEGTKDYVEKHLNENFKIF